MRIHVTPERFLPFMYTSEVVPQLKDIIEISRQSIVAKHSDHLYSEYPEIKMRVSSVKHVIDDDLTFSHIKITTTEYGL